MDVIDLENWPDDVTLGEVRAFIRKNADEGLHCPACGGFAKTYYAGLRSSDVLALVLMHYHFGHAAFHPHSMLPEIWLEAGLKSPNAAAFPSLKHWGLIEPVNGPEGDRRTRGWYRVTKLGAEFVRGERSVWNYRWIRHNEVVGIDKSVRQVNVTQALGDRLGWYEKLQEKRDAVLEDV